MIQPDATAIARARAVNARMPLSIPAGITLDDTHLPHITMLQRYLVTARLDEAYAAIAAVLAATDVAALGYHLRNHLFQTLGAARRGGRRAGGAAEPAGAGSSGGASRGGGSIH